MDNEEKKYRWEVLGARENIKQGDIEWGVGAEREREKERGRERDRVAISGWIIGKPVLTRLRKSSESQDGASCANIKEDSKLRDEWDQKPLGGGKKKRKKKLDMFKGWKES